MDKIQVYEDKTGDWRWRRVAPNGDIVADSGEGYMNRSDAVAAAAREATTEAMVEVDREPVEEEGQ